VNVPELLNSPWTITPEKLTEMCVIYAAHRNGESKDLKAIEAALGKPLQPGGAKPYTVQDGIATIPLEGVLSKRMSLFSQISGGQSYQSFVSELQQAGSDPEVMGIIVTVDSPGGAVDGTQQAANAVYAMRSVKPICTLVNGEMCSAAYWIGSAASEAYISSDTDVVGSIGVVTQHVDTSAAEYLRGIKVTDITAGKYKRIASQHAPLTPEGRSSIEDQLDHVYGVFLGDVARNLNTDADTVHAKMGDGRVFRGQQAIDAGLVVGKMTLPQLMQKMKSQQGGANSGAPNPKPMQKGKTSMSAENETTFTAAQLQAAKDEAHKAGLTAGLVQGRAEGATAERERIQAVEKVALPGHEKLIATLKFDGKTSGPEAAVQVLAAENTLRGDELAKLRAEAPKPVPASPGSAAADAEAANAKKEPTAIDAGAVAEQARTLVAKAKAEGKNLSFASAVAQLTAK
jgi:capsid assembly protease